MKPASNLQFLAALSLLLPLLNSPAAPPFNGTIFLDPDIVTPEDPTTFVSLTPAGRGTRQMYDRRSGWVNLNAFLFRARFSDSARVVEVQANPEFRTAAAAQATAEKYLPAIGQLPAALRRDLRTVWLHFGNNPFGGGNNNLLIHDGQGDRYIRDGILEETFIHEACHTSLDADHANAPGWTAAQAADPDFISTYARDNPTREDIAETYLLYLALRYRPDRISRSLAATIARTVPNRIKYFDSLGLDLRPFYQPVPPAITNFTFDPSTRQLDLTLRSYPARTYTVFQSDAATTWRPILSDIPSQGRATTVSTTLQEPSADAYFRVAENPQ